jgi:hypothetical protein
MGGDGPLPPPQRKLEVNPHQKLIFLPSRQQKFLLWEECGSFLERPIQLDNNILDGGSAYILGVS